MTAIAPSVTARRDPNLDFLRAAAILAVIAAHLPMLSPIDQPGLTRLTWGGRYGVDLFFVLSGWLISGIYFREYAALGRVSWPRFIQRRALRTMPPYYVALAIAYLSVAVLRSDRPRFDWGYLCFIQNYYDKLPYFAASWSLCIEEHFYAVLPALLSRVNLRSSLTGGVLFALVMVSPICRIALHAPPGLDDFDARVSSTHLHLDGLLVGVALRWLRAFRPIAWTKTQRACRAARVPAALALLGVYLMPAPLFYCLGYTYLSVLFGVILAGIVGAPPLPGSSWRFTQFTAIASYSVYLTHGLALHASQTAARHLPWKFEPAALACYYSVALILIAALGTVFYRIVEKAALFWRDRVAPA